MFSARDHNDIKVVLLPFWCITGVQLVHTSRVSAARLKYDIRRRFQPLVVLIRSFVVLKSQQKLNQKQLDQVDASDLVSSLVVQTNLLTIKQFKARKFFEGYDQFA